jgi:hypothetical protein
MRLDRVGLAWPVLFHGSSLHPGYEAPEMFDVMSDISPEL